MKKNKENSIIISAPISIGELFDKISILEIKKKKICGNKLDNIKKEYLLLNQILEEININLDNKLFQDLKKVNQILWNLEDAIREKERLKVFDQEFINIARDIYKTNDRRSKIKREINILNYSGIFEEKSY